MAAYKFDNISPGRHIVIKVEYGRQLHFKIFPNKSDRKKSNNKNCLSAYEFEF